jgi:hypothetical protein
MRINGVFISLCSGSVLWGDDCGADVNISLSKQIGQELVRVKLKLPLCLFRFLRLS